MASDLRTIFAAPKIAHALERIGDLSKNIAKRTEVISQAQIIDFPIISLKQMSELVQQMLRDAINAYANQPGLRR